MKKLLTALLIAALALGGSALAATYNEHGISFEYDEKFFTISFEEHRDDEDTVQLTDKNGNHITIYVRELKDGEAFPTLESFKELEQETGAKAEVMETWGNFRNTLSIDYRIGDFTEYKFVAPVYDDDNPNEIEAVLEVSISGNDVEGEEAAMESSDLTAEVVDTLKVVDD